MVFRKLLILFFMCMLLATSAHADEYYRGHLTLQQIERIREVKQILDGVDRDSMQKTIRELEKSRHPQVNIEMKEAEARAFTDIVQEINVEGQKKKEWLYSMICLNMAYLQFGGAQGKYGTTTELNRLIRQKLKEYLPPDINKQPGFLYSLE